MTKPQMPQMPKPQTLVSDKMSESTSHLDAPEQSGVEAEGLTVPDHDEFAKPQLKSVEKDSVSQVTAPAPKNGIEVEATRKGFYNQQRYEQGNRFKVRSRDELGEWMKCVDPAEEKRRSEYFKGKKIRALKKQKSEDEE